MTPPRESHANFNKLKPVGAAYTDIRERYVAPIKAGKIQDADAFTLKEFEPDFVAYRDHAAVMQKETTAKIGIAIQIGEHGVVISEKVARSLNIIVEKARLVVDSVGEVVALTESQIEATPEFGAHVHTAYLLGLAQGKGPLKTLLDIDRVVAPDASR